MLGIIPVTFKDWRSTLVEIQNNPLWQYLNFRKSKTNFSDKSATKGKSPIKFIPNIIVGVILLLALMYIVNCIFSVEILFTIRYPFFIITAGIFISLFVNYIKWFKKMILLMIQKDQGLNLAMIPWTGRDIFTGLIMAPSVFLNAKILTILIPFMQFILYIVTQQNTFTDTKIVFLLPVIVAINILVIILTSFLFTLNKMTGIVTRALSINPHEWAPISRYSFLSIFRYFITFAAWFVFISGILFNFTWLYLAPFIFILRSIILLKNINSNYHILIKILPGFFTNYLAQNGDSLRHPGTIYFQEDRGIFVVSKAQSLLLNLFSNKSIILVAAILYVVLYPNGRYSRNGLIEILQSGYVFLIPSVFFAIFAFIFAIRERILEKIIPVKNIYYKDTFRLSNFNRNFFVFFLFLLFMLFTFTLRMNFPLRVNYIPTYLYNYGFNNSDNRLLATLFETIYLILLCSLFYYFVYFLYNFIAKKAPVYFIEDGIMINHEFICRYESIRGFALKDIAGGKNYLLIFFKSAPQYPSLKIKFQSKESCDIIVNLLKRKGAELFIDEIEAKISSESPDKKSNEILKHKLNNTILLFVLFITLALSVEITYRQFSAKLLIVARDMYYYSYTPGVSGVSQFVEYFNQFRNGHDPISYKDAFYLFYQHYINHLAFFFWICLFAYAMEGSVSRIYGNWQRVFAVTQTAPYLRRKKPLV